MLLVRIILYFLVCVQLTAQTTISIPDTYVGSLVRVAQESGNWAGITDEGELVYYTNGAFVDVAGSEAALTYFDADNNTTTGALAIAELSFQDVYLARGFIWAITTNGLAVYLAANGNYYAMPLVLETNAPLVVVDVVAETGDPVFLGSLNGRKIYGQLLSFLDEVADASQLRRIRFLDEDFDGINDSQFDGSRYDERRSSFVAYSNGNQLMFSGTTDFNATPTLLSYADLPFTPTTVNSVGSVGLVRVPRSDEDPRFAVENGFLFLNVDTDQTYRYWLHAGNSPFNEYGLLNFGIPNDQRFAAWELLPELSGLGIDAGAAVARAPLEAYFGDGSGNIYRFDQRARSVCRLSNLQLATSILTIADNIQTGNDNALLGAGIRTLVSVSEIDEKVCATTAVLPGTDSIAETVTLIRQSPYQLAIRWSGELQYLDVYSLEGRLLDRKHVSGLESFELQTATTAPVLLIFRSRTKIFGRVAP